MATPGFAYFRTTGSTLLKTGEGSARAVSLGVAGVYGRVMLYDGLDATGTLIAVLDANTGVDLDRSCQFSTGLFVVVSDSPNVTISFF